MALNHLRVGVFIFGGIFPVTRSFRNFEREAFVRVILALFCFEVKFGCDMIALADGANICAS